MAKKPSINPICYIFLNVYFDHIFGIRKVIKKTACSGYRQDFMGKESGK